MAHMTPATLPPSVNACTGADPTPCDITQSQPFANLRARAALAGFTLGVMTETDGLCFYLLSRWGMSRTLADLGAVAVFLRQAGAPQ